MSKVRIVPRCARGENVFISSEGFLLPCCYAHILLRQSMAAPERQQDADLWFYRHRDGFDLTRRPLAEVLADPRWQELQRMWAEDRAPSICYRYCGVPADSAIDDPDHVRQQDRQLVPFKQSPPADDGAADRPAPSPATRARN